MRLANLSEANVANKLKQDPRLSKLLAIQWRIDATLPFKLLAKLGPKPKDEEIVAAWSELLDKSLRECNYGDLSVDGKFDMWITRLYANGVSNWEDVDGEVIDDLGKWHALSIRGLLDPRDQDFNRFPDGKSLHAAMRDYADQLQRIKNQAQIEKHKRTRSETILIDDDRFLVILPYNYGACYTFNNAEGVQANFCTGGSGGLSWSRNYMPSGPIIMVADKTNLNKKEGKWQMHAATDQLVDAQQTNRWNHTGNDLLFSQLFPGLMKRIANAMKSKEEEIKTKSQESDFISKSYDIDKEIERLKRTYPQSWASGETVAAEPDQQQNLLEAKATKTRLDPKCWKGKKIGNPKTKVKGGVRVNNCVPAESRMNSTIARSALGENDEHDKLAYRVQAIVQSMGAERKKYTIRVNADSEQQAIILANKEAKKYGTVISSRVLDDK